jgi:hypothetical protein
MLVLAIDHLLAPYPSLRVFRGIRNTTLPGDVGCLQFLRNFRQRHAFEQAALILQAAWDPAIASKAKKGAFATGFAHCGLLPTAIH